MDFKILIQGAEGAFSFQKAADISNNIYLSLSVRKGSLFVQPTFGSRLHLLSEMKDTDDAAAAAPGYVKEALQWMLDLGRLTRVETFVSTQLSRLNLLVSCWDSAQRKIEFTTFFEVR